MLRWPAFLAFFLLAGVNPCAGGDLSAATRVRCCYCSGTSVDWYQKKPQPLIVATEFIDRLCPDVEFSALDRKMGTAISREGNLESVVTVWESPQTLSFVEMSYGGAMVVTTIFLEESQEKDKYLSVRSDHTFRRDFPVPTQFFGACEILEQADSDQ